MALSENINNLEKAKFALNSQNETAVRTVTEVDGGKLSFSGLSVRLKITNVTISDTATPVPAISLTDRNSIMIQNRSLVDSFFLGESNVAASGVNEGWEVEATSFFTVDIKDTIIVYAIAPAGKTINLKIVEFA